MERILSTLSIYTSSSSTFITQLIAVWIIGQDDQRALLILAAFMPFGFALSSLSDSMRASALPIVSSADDGQAEDAYSTVFTLLLVALAVFGGLWLAGNLILPQVQTWFQLPMIAYLEFVDLLVTMCAVFAVITLSSVFMTCLYAKGKNAVATSVIVIANLLQLAMIHWLSSKGFGVMSLAYGALLSSSFTGLAACIVSRELRSILNPKRFQLSAAKHQITLLAGIIGPIFSSYMLLIAWLFYITHVLLDYNEAAASAFPLYARVQNLVILFSIAVGVAQAIRYNQQAASFDYSVLKNSTLQFVGHSFAYQVVVLGSVYWFSDEIAQWLVKEPAIAAECALYLRSVCPALIVLSTYVGMTVYMEQTFRSKRAFVYNLIYLVAEVALIETIRPYCTTTEELYLLLAAIFFGSAAFILFEIGKSRYDYQLMQKMQSVTL